MSPNSKSKRAVFIANKLPLKNDIESFIYRWNATYPIDRWWREKHKIAFNSPEHRVVSFLDIYTEWLEDKIYDKITIASLKNSQYKSGDWLEEKKEEISIEDEIREFESMDLTKLDDKHG